ncbi:24482_t:CDS:2 [Cetraspora pellucida]|uniref:24482_t:CDS:1 n=1 Tax=Cetraspora pellucida TaxID=1433469 RepID=A0A9N9E6P8_9GLOM|nr:24482_t:CDS:2 [Cetraspora pellucida]
MQSPVESSGLPKKLATYKLIKLFTTGNNSSFSYDHNFDIDSKDCSHTQLFYNITDFTDKSECTPSYCREVFRVDARDNLYWFNTALKAVPPRKLSQQPPSPQTLSPPSTPSTPKFPQTLYPPTPKTPQTLSLPIPKSPQTLSPPTPKSLRALSPITTPKSPNFPLKSPNPVAWSIEFGTFKCSRILRKVQRPKQFIITHLQTGAPATYTYVSDKKNSNIIPVLTGFSGEVNTPFDKTCDQRFHWILDPDNEKWSLVQSNDPQRPLVVFKKTSLDNQFLIVFLEKAPHGWSPRIADRLSKYLSAKSNDGQRRGSDSSSSVRSDSSSGYLTVESEEDDEKHWHEFVLASTVVVQDEVNPKKRRLWK